MLTVYWGPAVADAAATAGAWAGAVGAAIAVITLGITVAAGNRQRRREYDKEIREAESRGSHSRDEEIARIRADCEERVHRIRDDLTEARKEASNWRNIALGRGRYEYPPPP